MSTRVSRQGQPINNKVKYTKDIQLSIAACIEALEKAAEEYWYTCKEIAKIHHLQPDISKEQFIEQKLAEWLKGYPDES